LHFPPNGPTSEELFFLHSLSKLLLCATWRIRFIHTDFVTLMVFQEKYKLWSFSPCNFLQLKLLSLSLCLSLSLISLVWRTLFSNAINLCSSLNVRDQIATHTQPLIGL
jgi:hypothetical protein